MFNMSVRLWVVYGGVIEFNIQISTPGFYFAGYEIGAVVSDDAVWDPITAYDTGYELYHWSSFSCFNWFGLYPLSEFIYHNKQVFFLMASPLRGSTMSSPQIVKGQVMGIVHRAVGGIWL